MRFTIGRAKGTNSKGCEGVGNSFIDPLFGNDSVPLPLISFHLTHALLTLAALEGPDSSYSMEISRRCDGALRDGS